MTPTVDRGNQQLVGTSGERSIGQLVSDVSTDLSQIMRGEIELAKAEVKQDVQHAGKGAGMFAGAALFGLYGFGLLLLGLAGVLAIWLPWWASLLIVAAVLFVVAGILALIGKKQISQVKGKPERAIYNAKETVAAVKPSPAHLQGGTPPGAAVTAGGTTSPARSTAPAARGAGSGATSASAFSSTGSNA